VLSFSNNIALKDAVVVAQLKEAGAIPMVKGNIPQLVFSLHSENDIYGVALNPYCKLRTCGGSSGGDAGLVSARCVPLAIGTDIGGSIRVPAAFTGIYGFKPTANRVSYKGCVLPLPDGSAPQTRITAVPGPLATSVMDLKLVTEALMNESIFAKDICVPPVPFNPQLFDVTLRAPKLRFGFFEETHVIGCSTSVKRGMGIVIDKLRAMGHEVVAFPFVLQESQEYLDVHVGCCAMGVFGQFKKMLAAKGDAPISQYKLLFLAYGFPRFLAKIAGWIVRLTLGARMANTLPYIRPFSQDEIDSLLRRKTKFEATFKAKWDELELDGLICPAFPHAAFRSSEANDLTFLAHYTQLANVVGYPSGVVPVTEVLAGEDVPECYADAHNDIYTRKLKESMVGSKGMPIGIQVIGPKWKDEKCLAMMQLIAE